jgi:hypothetical protein
VLLQNCSVYWVKCPTLWLKTSEYGALKELYWQDATEELGEKSIPLPFCTPQFAHCLPLDWTRVSAVKSWWLPAWDVAGLTYWEETCRFASKPKYKILGLKGYSFYSFIIGLHRIAQHSTTHYLTVQVIRKSLRTSELCCTTTKTETAERSISIGREPLQVFLCTRHSGVLAGFTARRQSWRNMAWTKNEEAFWVFEFAKHWHLSRDQTWTYRAPVR